MQYQDSGLCDYSQQSENLPATLIHGAIAPEIVALGKDRKICVAANRDRDLRQMYALQAEARRLLPDFGVVRCKRYRAPGQELVRVMYDPGAGRSYYCGLETCNSIWACPVCSRRITENRRIELQAALERSELTFALVTFTLRHKRSDRLVDLNSALLGALRKLTSGATWQEFKADYGYLGWIRALEVVYGENGWHPHCHAIFVFEQPIDEIRGDAIHRRLKARWREILQKMGFDASWSHGVDFRLSRSDVADYVTKIGALPDQGWTLAHEVTKAAVKSSAKGGQTPWELLAASAAGDRRAGRLFREYACAMKGSRHLVYSPGLRARLVLPGGDEGPMEDGPGDDHEVMAMIEWTFWARIIVRHNLRAELLIVAAGGDVDDVKAWLDAMFEEYHEDYLSAKRVPARSARSQGRAAPGAARSQTLDPAPRQLSLLDRGGGSPPRAP